MLFIDRAAGKAFALSALVTVALAAFHDASTQHELASPTGSAGIWTELASARMAMAAIAAEVLAIAMLAASLFSPSSNCIEVHGAAPRRA